MAEDWIENARMIADSARGFLLGGESLGRIRKCRFNPPGYEPSALAAMAEMGWLMLRVPEEDGGLGLGTREYCTLAEVLGEALAPEPLIGAAHAARLLGAALPRLTLSGDMLVLAAWQETPNSLESAVACFNGRLSGIACNIVGASGADAFAVVTDQGAALVGADAKGLTLETLSTQDGGEMGLLRFDDVAPDLVAPCDASAALDEAMLAHSAFLLGLSGRAFAITLDYLRIRKQFDRPVGSFQALQHRATDIKVQMELARACIAAAATAIDEGARDAVRAAAVSRAKARASDLAMMVSREAVQMHGAIGYTDEADIGLFVRKAMTHANVFGSSRLHRVRYAALQSEFS